jgi:membrane protease YdiL (CAAX protease family)
VLRSIGAIFWDGERRRLRAGLRIGIHLALLGLMLFGVSRAAGVVPQLALGPIAFAGVIAITFVVARFVDRRRFADLGLRVDAARGLDLAGGALVGAASIALVAGIEWSAGIAEYTAIALDGNRAAHAALVALFFVGVAIQEELVFRGYQLVNLTEGLVGSRLPASRAATLATLLAALAFGLAHAGNDGASIVATLQVAVAGGTLLAVGFLLTGDLAFSIGLHFAWNFAQCVLGMPVSGFVLSDAALLTRAPHGSDLLTGGAFGPEASVIGLAAMLVGTAASLGWVRLRYGSLSLRLRLQPPRDASDALKPPLPRSSSAPPSGDH